MIESVQAGRPDITRAIGRNKVLTQFDAMLVPSPVSPQSDVLGGELSILEWLGGG